MKTYELINECHNVAIVIAPNVCQARKICGAGWKTSKIDCWYSTRARNPRRIWPNSGEKARARKDLKQSNASIIMAY